MLQLNSSQNIGCFSISLRVSLIFKAEVMEVIHAIEIAHQKTWRFIWLENDSNLDHRLFQVRSAP